jgi:hypothetical protein
LTGFYRFWTGLDGSKRWWSPVRIAGLNQISVVPLIERIKQPSERKWAARARLPDAQNPARLPVAIRLKRKISPIAAGDSSTRFDRLS